jgi:pimeloyl-ACP methyl ester carboxylesterase
MSAFAETLPDGKSLTGKTYFAPRVPASCISALPLIIALHGGTYTSDYFDVDENHTIRHISLATGIPVIAINRPGYAGTSPLPETPAQSSFIKEQGKYLHRSILPFLWTKYASSLGVSSVFLYGHSIGGAICVVAASLHGSEHALSVYPLSGISISGVGSNVKTLPMEVFKKDAKELAGISIRFPNDQKDMLMLGPAKLYDPTILEQTERLQHEATVEELHDINMLWRSYWRQYAAEVVVSVLYTLGEYDELWNKSDQDVKDFADGFVKAPTVESRRLLSAPHCIEHSLQATGLTLRTFGFAIECGVYCKLRTP